MASVDLVRYFDSFYEEPAAPSLIGKLREMAGKVSAHFRARRDYQQLAGMPDYLLQDVGITRSDVLSALRRQTVF
ncbi:DUF1127 domain-containing protein [Agrobacterium sp. ES01]|uniref:DUF1127 domain-containing protein n=1 Tax=Agrobacterium sp. ES01 TaxID=3420714 RepID=UPI003D0CA4A3